MKKKYIVLLVILIIFVTLFLLLYRSPVNAQSEKGVSSEILVEIFKKNFQHHGIFIDDKNPFIVEDKNAVSEILLSDNEFFLVPRGHDYIPIKFGYYKNLIGSSRENYLYLNEKIVNNFDIGDRVYVINFNEHRTHITISRDGTRSSGLFSLATRIESDRWESGNPVFQAKSIKESCKKSILTYNIWRNPAEVIEVCIESSCSKNIPDICSVKNVNTQTYWFGEIVYNPSDVPVNGLVIGSLCRGFVKYKWGVSLSGRISVKNYVDIGPSNIAMGGESTIFVERFCEE